MSENTSSTNSVELQTKFNSTHPNFQSKLRDIASNWTNGPIDVLEVYAKWRTYSDACSAYDQSALISEFLSWNNQTHLANRY